MLLPLISLHNLKDAYIIIIMKIIFKTTEIVFNILSTARRTFQSDSLLFKMKFSDITLHIEACREIFATQYTLHPRQISAIFTLLIYFLIFLFIFIFLISRQVEIMFLCEYK